MKTSKNQIARFVLAIFLLVLPLTGLSGQFFEDWNASGTNPESYEMGGDPTVAHGKEGGGFIISKEPLKEGFGTWMTEIGSEKYLGKRVRLSGYLMTEDVTNWAGLWMRVDVNDSTISFDNMMDRVVKGTSGWEKYDIVLDVPSEEASIYCGVFIQGEGSAWVDGFKIDVVGNDVLETGLMSRLSCFKHRDYEKAAELFCNAVEKEKTQFIYDHLFYFLSLYGAEKMEEADSYIRNISNTLNEDEWVNPVIHFFAGKISEDALWQASENEDERIQKEQKCEAYYYVGMLHLFKGNKKKAKSCFEKCIDTGLENFIEYDMAKTELARI